MSQAIQQTKFFQKAAGTLVGGLIGDAIGTPTEGMSYTDIESKYGWVDDFDCDGTDDTIMKYLLAETLISSDGFASYDDWAQTWLDNWESIFGDKKGKFFISVLHTAVKLHEHSIPRMAALGNMPSSSSAMCIAPVGIVNACNPRQAADQAYNLASLIHIHDVSFCLDGAAVIAAAVAAAFIPDATVDSILNAALNALVPVSGKEMADLISDALETASQASDYEAFRQTVYADGRFFCRILCDSRETIPLTLALFRLGQGDMEKVVTYAANFGRDADTLGAILGALAGAIFGAENIPAEWIDLVRKPHWVCLPLTKDYDVVDLAKEMAEMIK